MCDAHQNSVNETHVAPIHVSTHISIDNTIPDKS